jgi:hypothetical protein
LEAYISVDGASRSFEPPNAPWIRLNPDPHAGAYLSVYLSDPSSPVLVRDVTRVANNKSDPNLETGTFGLFSTCERAMRTSVVTRRIGAIFFMTHGKHGRVLVGMYELGWYAPGASSDGKPDWALAAVRVRFVHPAVSLSDLPEPPRAVVSTRFRCSKLISTSTAERLHELLEDRADRTALYLEEIDRLERFNRSLTGFRYVGWRNPGKFDWVEAQRYLVPSAEAMAGPWVATNSSPSGRWVCISCGYVVVNMALLKSCPGCRAIGTLRPEVAEA